MRLLTASVAAFCTITGAASSFQTAQPPSPRVELYDRNSSHLWNRIHEHFQVRTTPDGTTYGVDALDPLLWRDTRYLLSGPSHGRAVRLLDEFLTSGGERLVADPLRRAVFQHDLWAIFDWLASTSIGDSPARTALMQRVARVIRRVALTKTQIEALPDTYAAAVASGAFEQRAGGASRPALSLPRDLFDASGSWVVVSGLHRPVVPHHASELGRSAFIVLWSIPGGSATTAAYLRKLWDFPQPFVADSALQLERDRLVYAKPNPALPAVPDGTRIALVRKMMLIDRTGAIVPSPVIQSVQLRVFPGRQSFAELRMSRADLFAGRAGGLRMIQPDEGDFVTFSSKGMDPIERASHPGPLRLRPILDGCANCHHVEYEPAIQTIQSLPQILRPMPLVDSRHFPPTTAAVEAKRHSFEWGVLQSLWQMQSR